MTLMFQARLLYSIFSEDNVEDAKRRADLMADSISNGMDAMWLLAFDGPGTGDPSIYVDKVRDTAFAM